MRLAQLVYLMSFDETAMRKTPFAPPWASVSHGRRDRDGYGDGGHYIYKLTQSEFEHDYSARNPDVVKVMNADATKTTAYWEAQSSRYYSGGHTTFPYNAADLNCTTVSYRSYQAGGVAVTSKPWDFGENPRIYPTDMNQALRWMNKR
jgi:hypothetical protein